MRHKYEEWNPTPTSQAIVRQAIEICVEYAASGYDLTLRQLYYQFVARALIPNTQRSYKNLGSIINKARLAGLLDWSYIVDRTRNLEDLGHWENAEEMLRSAASNFMLDRWKDQDYRVEVWIEKDALTGVIERICTELDVPYFSCRGYTSQSELWRAAQRQLGYEAEGKDGIIIHLGDHDPSGIDMTRDIKDRMWTFGANVIVDRIALNWDQIELYDPPPNPTKLTDSRAGGYIRRFGNESWELDALEPSVMTELVNNAVLPYRDEDIHEETIDHEEDIIEGLIGLSHIPWSDVRDFVEENRQ